MTSSPFRRLLALLAVALVGVLAAAPAQAATQIKLDADDSVRNDLLRASWEVDALQTTLSFDVDVNDADFGDWVFFYTDVDRDGRADFALEGSIGRSDHTGRFQLVRSQGSTDSCQKTSAEDGTKEVLLDMGQVSAQIVDGHERFTLTWATNLTAGAQSFDWAAYANTWNGNAFAASGWDYMPDAANADPARTTPSPSVNDHCDLNGNGVFGSSDESAGRDGQSGWAPMRISEGFSFPDPADPGTGAGGGQNPGGNGGGGQTPGGNGNGGGGPADPLAGFTKTDTSRTFKMPKVTGLAADTAKERILRAGGYVDFDVREVNTAKAPKGVGFTDVMSQTPKAGASLASGAGALPKVVLEVYAGPKPKGKADCMDKLVRDLKGMEYAQAIDLLKKAGCRPEYDFKLGSGNQATVTKVTPKAGDRVELQVSVPKDPRKNDLFLSFRESPNQLSFDAADWKLTADRDQRNFITFQVLDRAGRFVQRANVRLDTSDVGAPSDPSVAVTDLHGERSTSFLAPKAGKVDVVVWTVGANDVAVYGTAQLIVKDRKAKPGATFTTTSGRVLALSNAGAWRQVATARGSALARAAATNPFDAMWGWFTRLIGAAPRVQQVQAQGGSAQQKVSRISTGPKLFPATLAIGGQPVGVVSAGGMNVVAAGGGNVVAAGGGNVVAAGGGNVVAAGGMNLATVAGSGLMAIDPNKLLSDNGLGVVAAGGMNVISAGGANVISAGGANVVAAGGMNLRFAVGNGVIAAGGGNVVSAGGMN